MNASDTLLEEIAAYLRREFGEAGPDGLQASDLVPLGERLVGGVSMRVWQFQTHAGPMWATVEPLGDSYCIGMCEVPPGAEAAGPVLRVTAAGVTQTVPLEVLDDGLVGLPTPWVLPGHAGGATLSVEVLTAQPPELCLALECDGGPGFDLRCGLPCTVVWGDCIVDVRAE